jgi:predicted DNA-binding protein (UPF0278 family)
MLCEEVSARIANFKETEQSPHRYDGILPAYTVYIYSKYMRMKIEILSRNFGDLATRKHLLKIHVLNAVMEKLL